MFSNYCVHNVLIDLYNHYNDRINKILFWQNIASAERQPTQ